MSEEPDWLDDPPADFEWKDGEVYAGPWYAVPGGLSEDRTSRDAWTISPDPKRPGWCTDDGTGGYGLPRAVAEDLARRLSAVQFVGVDLAAGPSFGVEMLATMDADGKVHYESFKRIADAT